MVRSGASGLPGAVGVGLGEAGAFEAGEVEAAGIEVVVGDGFGEGWDGGFGEDGGDHAVHGVEATRIDVIRYLVGVALRVNRPHPVGAADVACGVLAAVSAAVAAGDLLLRARGAGPGVVRFRDRVVHARRSGVVGLFWIVGAYRVGGRVVVRGRDYIFGGCY